MTVFVYAVNKSDAAAWARQNGIRPRDCVLFGSRARWRNEVRIRPDDRVVVLGEILPMFEAAIARSRARQPNAPEVERYPGRPDGQATPPPPGP